MMRMSRRKPFASVVLLSICLGMAGCMSTGDDRMSMQQGANGPPEKARGSNPGSVTGPSYPVQMPSGPIDTTSYPPRQRYMVQASNQPGQPEEISGELGMPTSQGMTPRRRSDHDCPGPMMGPGGPPLPTELNPTGTHRIVSPLRISSSRHWATGPAPTVRRATHEPMEVFR